MRLKNWIGILIVAFVAFETSAFAYQRIDIPGVKPKKKQEQLVPVEFISPEDLKAKIAKSETVTIVDLRGPNIYASSDRKIKGAVHTKVRRVVYRFKDLPRDREMITYCACPADEAAVIGAQALLGGGFKRVRVLKGGWNAWLGAGGQVVAKPKTL